MDQRTRAALASGLIGAIFLLVQLGSLALVEPFQTAGYQAVDDPQDPTNSVLYFVAILAVTAVMLVVIKLEIQRLMRAVIVGASAYIGWYVFSVIVPSVVTVSGVNVLAVGAALGLGLALYFYPEWYVIDASGIVMGAGAAGIFGISFGLLPALVLLIVLAVYDAISVYGTEHMLTLASGVMDLKVPVVLVVPLTLSYSFLSAETPDPAEDDSDDVTGDDETGDSTAVANGGAGPDDTESADGADIEADPMDRDALFIGLGDAVIPTVLVASAAFFSPPGVPSLGVPGLALTLPALTAMIGTLVGLAILLWMVLKGRAHAGLPLLNGGAIAGYLVGALASGIPLLDAIGLATYL